MHHETKNLEEDTPIRLRWRVRRVMKKMRTYIANLDDEELETLALSLGAMGMISGCAPLTWPLDAELEPPPGVEDLDAPESAVVNNEAGRVDRSVGG